MRNKAITYLKFMNRLRRGHMPIFLEYPITFKSRWDNNRGNVHLAEQIEANAAQFDAIIAEIATFAPLVEEIQNGQGPVPGINWKNYMLPAFDALSLMWAAKRTKRRFIEIGSGNSTMFVRSILRSSNSSVKLTSIDPQPRAEIDALCDEVVRKPLETVDLSLFDDLNEGDTVFLDSSHQSFMNSDVTVFMLDILPVLKPGVLIGLHDIFLPYDYYQSWAPRAYNEQYLLACYLLANKSCLDIKLANHWICRQGRQLAPLEAIWKILGADVRDQLSSAFWVVKTA